MRDNLKLTMESPNTNTGRQSFRHRSAIAWNNIPNGLKKLRIIINLSVNFILSAAVRNISFNDSAFVSNKDLSNFKYF